MEDAFVLEYVGVGSMGNDALATTSGIYPILKLQIFRFAAMVSSGFLQLF